MIKKEVVISDYYELLALHKALVEAKFNPQPINSMVSASPYVASIAERVVKLLIDIDSDKKPEKEQEWNKTLNIRNQKSMWNICKQKATDFELWDRIDDTKKREYTMCLFSPFRYTKNDIDEFINVVSDLRCKKYQ